MATMDVQLRSRGWLRNALHSRKVLVGLGILIFFVLLGVDRSSPGGEPLRDRPGRGRQDRPASIGSVRPTPARTCSPSSWTGRTRRSSSGFVASAIATFIAVAIGLLSAFLGGIWDEILSTITNVFLVIPALPLVIVLAGYLHGAGALAVSVVIAVTAWPWTARVLRAQTLSIRRRDYVQAARVAGESTTRIIWFEIVPNEIPLIAAQFLITVLYAILIQAGLAFLGVGSVTSWSWGTMLYWAQNAEALSLGAWWWFVPPGLCLALLGTGLALMNFGVDEIANPRLSGTVQIKRTRRARTGALRLAPGIGEPGIGT